MINCKWFQPAKEDKQLFTANDFTHQRTKKYQLKNMTFGRK